MANGTEARAPMACECGEHAFVRCTRGVTAMFDTASIPLVREWRWCADRKGYILRRLPKSSGGRAVYMHRVVIGARVARDVDHADGNKSNNRTANLRIATRAQNLMNRRATSRSGMKGLGAHGDGYTVTISKTIRGKRTHFYLGKFYDKVAGAKAYDRAARKLFGKWARTNFPVDAL